MTSRISHSPIWRILQEEHYEWKQQPEIQKELCECLFGENIANIINIRNWNPDKLKERSEKYRTEYLRRVKHVLLDILNNEPDTKKLQSLNFAM